MDPTSRSKLSTTTQRLIDECMVESKLSVLQKQGIQNYLKNQKPLPVPEKKSEIGPPVIKPKVRRPKKFLRVRTKQMIENSGGYDRDPLPPNPGKCLSDTEKDSLAHYMEFRQKLPSPDKIIAFNKKEGRRRTRTSFEEQEEIVSPTERFAQLIDEINERKTFRDEMENTSAKEDIIREINGQIAEKLYEMNLILKHEEKDK